MIKVGIIGYGNLGKGAEKAVCAAKDMALAGVFPRRDPAGVKTVSGAKVYSADDLKDFVGKIDVMILCGGSATDLPKQTAEYVKMFNTVDSFDTHAKIPEHFAAVDKAAKESGKIGLISVGWDPGLFSMARLLFGAVLPDGNDYTFWGRGVSQGHSDAIRRVAGVKDARQYTVPVEQAVEAVRRGENPQLTTRDKHKRECYVAAEEGADLARIEKEIPFAGVLLKKDKDLERSLGESVDVKLFRAMDRQKEFTGILKAWDKDTVTLEFEEEAELVIERSNIALIRLAFDF